MFFVVAFPFSFSDFGLVDEECTLDQYKKKTYNNLVEQWSLTLT
jgi:hypothetical protein